MRTGLSFSLRIQDLHCSKDLQSLYLVVRYVEKILQEGKLEPRGRLTQGVRAGQDIKRWLLEVGISPKQQVPLKQRKSNLHGPEVLLHLLGDPRHEGELRQ